MGLGGWGGGEGDKNCLQNAGDLVGLKEVTVFLIKAIKYSILTFPITKLVTILDVLQSGLRNLSKPL